METSEHSTNFTHKVMGSTTDPESDYYYFRDYCGIENADIYQSQMGWQKMLWICIMGNCVFLELDLYKE